MWNKLVLPRQSERRIRRSGIILGTKWCEIKCNKSQWAKSDCQGAVSSWITCLIWERSAQYSGKKGLAATRSLCMASPDNEAHAMNCSSPVASTNRTLISYLERIPTELKMKKIHWALTSSLPVRLFPLRTILLRSNLQMTALKYTKVFNYGTHALV